MDDKWMCPIFEISGIPLNEGNFTWAITSGAEPYVGKIVCNKDISEKIDNLNNPVYLKMVLTGGTEGKPEGRSMQFDKLYIIEKRQIDQYYDCWFIADRRYLFSGKQLYCSYNKTRTANVRNITVPALGEGDPASIRQPFESVAGGRYLPWSIMSGTRPYKMSEIIQLELQKLGIYPYYGTINADYVIENVEYYGVPLYEALNDLLYKGRLNMTVTPAGEVGVYSVDSIGEDLQATFLDLNKVTLGPGKFYIQEKKWSRPKIIGIKFEKLQEIRVVASSSNDIPSGSPLPITPNRIWTKADINGRPPSVIGCENVIKVPYETKNKTDGGYFQIGEYVPMWKYLNSINLPEDKVRELWFSDHLYRWYARKEELKQGGSFTVENERFAKHIISNVKDHYRQVYRIEPYWMDRIESWSAKRVGVVDNYTHTMVPSPVFSDYCVIPNQRCPIFAKRKAVGAIQAYNWLVNEKDIYRNNPTAGRIEVLNRELGIFRIVYPPLIDQVIKEIIPCAVTPLPYPAVNGEVPLIETCRLYKTFTFDTIISVKWSTGNQLDRFDDASKFYRIDSPDTKGVAPYVEALSKLEYARFMCKEYDARGNLIEDGTAPVNESILKAIALSESDKRLNAHKNRLYGLVELPGFVGIPVEGHMVGVVYNFDDIDGLKTIVDMRGMPPFLARESYLDEDQLSYLYKQLPRGDFKNDFQGI